MIINEHTQRARNLGRLAMTSVAAAVLAIASVQPARAAMERFSGTVLAVDTTRRAITVGEVGPWRIEAGQTVIVPHTVHVSFTTEFFDVERRAEAGAAGWPGGFVETPLGLSNVKVGDFVTVQAVLDNGSLVASKVWVLQPDVS